MLCAAALTMWIVGAACGDDDDASFPTAEPDPVADPVADPGPEEIDTEVEVTLSEWGIAPEVQTVEAGAIRLFARNIGDVPHELVICQDSCEEGEIAELAEVENIVPGTRRSFAVELEAGRYELACLIVGTNDDGQVEDHYALGMRTAFTIE